MAPTSDKSKPSKSHGRDRRSKSRNTTPVPVSVTVEPTHTSLYLNTSLNPLIVNPTITLEDVLDRNGTSPNIPSSVALGSMQDKIKDSFVNQLKQRGETCDRALREVTAKRKEHEEQERNKESQNLEAEERKRKLKKMSKRASEDRPLAVGAHGLARQDGVDVHKETSSSISSPVSQAPPSAGTAPADGAPSPTNSDASHQPPPMKPVPKFQTFGPNPVEFDDPTVYHIRDITPGMSDEEKKEILCVNVFPKSDLHDLTAGTPPDQDFSAGKAQSQVTATAFGHYVEPYIRPLTEEDAAFLKERGDRITPFVLPPRGPRSYKEIWAEEDGGMAIDPSSEHYPPYDPRGSYDQMGDDQLEQNNISVGPVVSRLLATLRPERRESTNEPNGVNGDSGAMDIDGETQQPPNGLSPATHMPESEAPGWKAPPQVGKGDYQSLDDRMLQELRYIGFLAPEDTPNYVGHYDDEVAARLRLLQSELRKQSIINGARKARISELTSDRMAMQEYQQIADDLDNQLNAAYLKRNRNMGKGKKIQKRPGGAGGGSHPVAGGTQRPAVGEPIRMLMDRKATWNSVIGPVVDYGKAKLPEESIFKEEIMREYMRKEEEGWNEQEE
ncbi:hypothetical protein EJ05DRAFT_358704 [Pseudovirgaria hyperparasitica]|uniref:Transcriptional regulator Ngg1 n=1 Tax=Pseudovirgaria hyperparasitica TaxID=470096 RepID=A0A6A6W7J4_9PEZI|nr:uncharacterized protein EJ05DRAFT_358704 [Pseudovirgaria hyperparasitica]KAF2758603.1 hypothetical protein EJ05DRAFT_358704 [Pseudovirgaria hyperparasitica]